jgi:hypothetical protein
MTVIELAPVPDYRPGLVFWRAATTRRPYGCPDCRFNSPQLFGLVNHIRGAHARWIPFLVAHRLFQDGPVYHTPEERNRRRVETLRARSIAMSLTGPRQNDIYQTAG